MERYLNQLMDPIRKKFDTPDMKKLTSAAYPAKGKKGKPGSPAKAGGGGGGGGGQAATEEVVPSRLDIKIGKVVSVSRHPEAESLYVEKVDLGEPVPRTIVSGLVKHVPESEMTGRMVVVLCNLKPAKLKGVESRGMVLCSSSAEDGVEPLSAPEGSEPGDRVFVEGYEDGAPDEQLNPKRKVWEKLSADLRTAPGTGEAQWDGNALATKRGPVVSKVVKGAPIK